MSETPRLAPPLLAAAQAQKHLTVNEALARLDALVQASVQSRSAAGPPASPEEGAAWIVPAGAADAWAGMAGRIASRFSGGWSFLEPADGWLVHVADEGRLVLRTGGVWRDLAEAAVFHAAGEGVQLKLVKPAPADTASVLLQTAYSGRAEIGLVGDDDLVLKVSPDGALWSEAMRVDRSTARASFPAGATRAQTLAFSTTTLWTPPAWARLLVVTAIGAGGGGGAGRRAGATVDRRGGNGGASGGLSQATFVVADLPASFTVEAGSGGAGGAPGLSDDTDGANGGAGGASGLRVGSDWMLWAGGGSGGTGGRVTAGSNATGGAGNYGRGGSGGAGGLSGLGAPDPALGQSAGGGGGGGGITGAGLSGAGGAGAPGSLITGPGARAATGGVGGAAGLPGSPGAPRIWLPGAGAGGGGGGAAAAGGVGGTGGGGGGGGGASTNGTPSGAGGAGGAGEVVIAVFG